MNALDPAPTVHLDPEVLARREERNRHFEQYKLDCEAEREVHGEFLVVKMALRNKAYHAESEALDAAAGAVARWGRDVRLVLAYANRLVVVIAPSAMEQHFKGDSHKIASELASRATGEFIRHLAMADRLGNRLPLFTATVMPMPSGDMVDFLQYTQFGAELYSLEKALDEAGVPQDARRGVPRPGRLAMLKAAGVDWYTLAATEKRGRVFAKSVKPLGGKILPTPLFVADDGLAFLQDTLGLGART